MATMVKNIGTMSINTDFPETLLSSIPNNWNDFVKRYPQVLEASKISAIVHMEIPNYASISSCSSSSGASYSPDVNDVMDVCQKAIQHLYNLVSCRLGENWSYATGSLFIEATIEGMHEHFHYIINFSNKKQ